MDLEKYWNNVRAVMAQLPRERIYYLISIENSDKGIQAGRVMDISDPKMVARRIVDRTHILASPEDIQRFKDNEQHQLEELAAVELARKGQLAMPKELQDLVRLATQGARPAEPPSKKEK